MIRSSDQALARQILWLLLESKNLKPVHSSRVVAPYVHYFPEYITLLLPAEEPYLELINPVTRPEGVERLREALLHLVEREEGDHWVVTTRVPVIEVQLLDGLGRAKAWPYESSASKEAVKGEDSGPPVLRITLGGERQYLHRNQGLMKLRSGGLTVTVVLADDSAQGGQRVAYLLADGAMEVEIGDGTRVRLEPRHRAEITHDLRFKVWPRRGRFWQRPVEGEIVLLGVPRMSRPDLVLIDEQGQELVWDRNREPSLVLSNGMLEGGEAVLRSGAGDLVYLINRGTSPYQAQWFDGKVIRVEPGNNVPVLGAHLQALSHRTRRLRVQVDGSADPTHPTMVEVVGKGERASPKESAVGLFGYEIPRARVLLDGYLLEEAPGGRIDLMVPDPALRGSLMRIALDGCPGCKVMALRGGIKLGHRHMEPGMWEAAEDLSDIRLPGLRLRLEALEIKRLVLDHPLPVHTLTADPERPWKVRGWKVLVMGNGLEVQGKGFVPLVLDGRVVEGPLRVDLRPQIQAVVGHEIFRIVSSGSKLTETQDPAVEGSR